MRILLTGASGFVGSHIGTTLCGSHDVLGLTFSNTRPLPFPSRRLDLTDEREALAALFSEFAPDIVIHAAAMSRVIDCEKNPERAKKVNIGVTRSVAKLAAETGCRTIFFSSDQVFSGGQGLYSEDDTPDPVSVYGRTKLEAEHATLMAASTNLVVRSNSVVGPSLGLGESFSAWVLETLRRRDPVILFADQYRSPIHIRAMVRVVRAACEDVALRGVLHVGGIERLSRRDVGFAVAQAYGLGTDLLKSGSYHSHPFAACMTADTSYDVSRQQRLCPSVELLPLSDELATDARQETMPQ